jgi:hypothetical protein
MSFEQQLQRIFGHAATDARHEREDRERAPQTVALHAPYVLRRYAEIAAAFAAQGMRSAQGAISARHDDRRGYHEVEYNAPDLHIRFGLVAGAAHLHWRTASDERDCVIAAETGRAEIDAALLDAVSSFVGARTQAAPDGVDRP